MNTRKRAVFGATSVAIALVAYACATPLTPEDVRLRPTALVASTAATMSATVGTVLTNTPVVTVLDQFDEPMPGVNVTFSASSGTQPTPATKATDADGKASPTSWTLPTTAGSVTLTATVAGSTALGSRQFVVTLNPGPASQAAVATTTPSSNNQTAPVGTAVPVVPQVRVSDQYGNAVAGVQVTFAITSTTGGTVVPTTAVTTDASGIARATSWTLGTTVGTNTLRATVAGVATPVVFTATGTAGAAASITVAPGTPSSQGQSAVANTNVPVAPSVLVRDANGNPVAGVVTRFTIGGGGGRILTSATDNTGVLTLDVTTNASGIATIPAWRLGSVGANTMSVNIPSIPAVTAFVFSATATVGPPATIAVSNAAWAQTRVSTAHAGNPSVLVRDQGGNPVSGATVVWTSGNANSTVTGTASSTTNAAGIAFFPKATAAWTAGTTVGAVMQLIATVQGSSPVLSVSTSSTIVGNPTQITVSAGNNQSAGINADVAVPPAAIVRDTNNVPVPGVSVTFTVTAGGGSITTPSSPSSTTTATAITDSNGVARVTTWRLGSTVGTSNNTLRATITSQAQFVDFTASATAGTPSSITARTGNPTTGPANSAITVGVVVRDAAGNLVQGASVNFAVPTGSGNAAVTGTTPVVTNAAGEAQVTWRLDTLARTNTLNATVGTTSVTTSLTATSTPLAASRMVITQGNNQTGAPSTALPTQPMVRVTDQYNNVVNGASVTFATAAGSGTISGTGCSAVTSCVQTTASGGVANVVWTLGPSAGTQTMNAFLTATPAVTVAFTATAGSGNSCSPTGLTFGTTVNGTIANTDCPRTGGFFSDIYNITVPAGNTREMAITYSSSAFNPTLWAHLWGAGGASWGWTNTSSLTAYYVMGPGTYEFHATTGAAGQTGAYTLLPTLNPAEPAGCADFVVTKNITVSDSLDLSCNYTTSTQTGPAASKRYIIFIPANTSATVRMNAGSLADPYLECFDVTSSFASPVFITGCFSDDEGGAANSLMTIPISTSGRYVMIRASHYNAGGTIAPTAGRYTLIIDP